MPSPSAGVEINGPNVTIENDIIYVTTSLSLDEKYLKELKDGLKKELHFYIDIFKVWNVWPDEFIYGKQFIRTLKYDPVKTEYIATSNDGNILIEKKFKSFESMLKWSLSFQNIQFIHIKDLEPGAYFIRVTVESKIRKMPPVIRDFFPFILFLSENEFKIKKDSSLFHIGF